MSGRHLPNGTLKTEQHLNGGEVAKLELGKEHIRKLLMGLEALTEAALVKGIELRLSELVVGREQPLVRGIERESKAIIEQLITNGKGEEFWDALCMARPDITEQPK